MEPDTCSLPSGPQPSKQEVTVSSGQPDPHGDFHAYHAYQGYTVGPYLKIIPTMQGWEVA